ncbi:hypothetical protein [Spiroplasma endosymbiont of Aleiodes alternator]
MNTFLKIFLTQRLQFCVYFILDVQKKYINKYFAFENGYNSTRGNN